jgi:hypothetical protein
MGYAYANGFPVILESLRVGILRTLATVCNIFFCVEGWRMVWGLDPERGSYTDLKTFATRGRESRWLGASVSGGGYASYTPSIIVPCRSHYNWGNPRDTSVSEANTCVWHCLLSFCLSFYMQRFLVSHFHSAFVWYKCLAVFLDFLNQTTLCL